MKLVHAIDQVIYNINNPDQKTKTVDFSNARFYIPLIFDIILLFKGITEKEVSHIIKNIKKEKGIDSKLQINVKKYLFLLEKMKLIEEYKAKTGQYFYRVTNDYKNIGFYIFRTSSATNKIERQLIPLYDGSRDEYENTSKTDLNLDNNDVIDIINVNIGVNKPDLFDHLMLAPTRYKHHNISKKSGGERQISNPTSMLKSAQRTIVNNIINDLPINKNVCTAYLKGVHGIKENATKHKANKFILKMDFSNFFHSITVKVLHDHILQHFVDMSNQNIFMLLNSLVFVDKQHQRKYSRQIKQLRERSSHIRNMIIQKTDDKLTEQFFKEGIDILLQSPLKISVGAPSSPFIANTILCDFDKELEEFCKKINVIYSRYADDLTFSTREPNILNSIKNFVYILVEDKRFNFLSINNKKTHSYSKKHQQQITGLIITTDGNVSIGKKRKKEIKLLLKLHKKNELDTNQESTLLGYLNFLQSIEPSYFDNLMSMNSNKQTYKDLQRNYQKGKYKKIKSNIPYY